ncbi:unnamed protein product, partial [Phaeothamnion confervicola]
MPFIEGVGRSAPEHTPEGLRTTKVERAAALQAEGAAKSAPEGYTSNSNKEAMCLEFLGSFSGQFASLFPERRPLFLTARNEFGVEKFVSTTLRPTLLPHREVYGLGACAEFVARLLHYEPLEEATEFPSYLPSPSQTLTWCVGDSFDFAVVLASFLLGSGYDAFVAYGAAPQWVTHRDQSRTGCP